TSATPKEKRPDMFLLQMGSDRLGRPETTIQRARTCRKTSRQRRQARIQETSRRRISQKTTAAPYKRQYKHTDDDHARSPRNSRQKQPRSGGETIDQNHRCACWRRYGPAANQLLDAGSVREAQGQQGAARRRSPLLLLVPNVCNEGDTAVE